ncbi:hypothetical protein DQ04_00631080 [Trypanosoma grayi]|uniref:hypothetical protein n=1 Tax=Trypanosoma grayi TaxID=71804 RepID=UPI0004F46540|nr:hypothetical protein DQ04_00631080 [Trypanosoma grayi]KEG14084.1 hypothetical protein DQ04_00631080 [Trypanosoma grayi]
MVESCQGEVAELSKAMLTNNPNDERYIVEGARYVQTPPNLTFSLPQSQEQEQQHQQEQQMPTNGPQDPSSHPQPPLQNANAVILLGKKPDDELVLIEDMQNIATPLEVGNRNSSRDRPVGWVLRNAPHDEVVPVSTHGSSIGTPIDGCTTSGYV